MLARVVCHKCHKDLKIHTVNVEVIGIVVVVESCNSPGCTMLNPDESSYERHLSDLLTIDINNDYFLGGEI